RRHRTGRLAGTARLPVPGTGRARPRQQGRRPPGPGRGGQAIAAGEDRPLSADAVTLATAGRDRDTAARGRIPPDEQVTPKGGPPALRNAPPPPPTITNPRWDGLTLPRSEPEPSMNKQTTAVVLALLLILALRPDTGRAEPPASVPAVFVTELPQGER